MKGTREIVALTLPLVDKEGGCGYMEADMLVLEVMLELKNAIGKVRMYIQKNLLKKMGGFIQTPPPGEY